MKKNFKIALSILFATVLIFGACDSKYPGFKKTDTGLYYKIHVSNDTLKPVLSDIVSIDMEYGPKDSIIFSSYKSKRPVKIPIIEPQFKGDFYEALTYMSVGDSATFIISADSFFHITARSPKRPPFIDSNSVLYFNVKLNSIQIEEEIKKEEQEKNAILKIEEGEKLKLYLSDNKITIKPTESGLYYIETKRGRGSKIDTSDWVKIHFAINLLNGNKIFSTRDRGEPIEIEYGKKFDTDGLEEAIGKMKKGGKANLIVPSSIAFGEMGRGGAIPPFSTLLYDVEIIDVRSKAEYEKEKALEREKQKAEKQKLIKSEKTKITKYINDNNITSKPTKDGLYYVETLKGTGEKAESGKKVKVHYSLYLTDGTKLQSSLDSGQPFEFTLGKGQVIRGWDEGITMMNEGGKAKLIIPSIIGYGERGKGSDIPPFTPLVFEVELLEVN